MISVLRLRIRELQSVHIPENSLRARFAKGSMWLLVGMFIAQGLALLASIAVARHLGKTGFGELGVIQSTVAMFGVFAGFGLGLTATKYVAEYRSSDPDRAGRVIGLSLAMALASGGLLAVILFVMAPFLAAHSLGAPDLTLALRIGSGLLFFNAVTGAQNGCLAGFEAFKAIAVVNFCRGILTFPLVIVGAYWWNLSGALAGMTGAAGAGWLLGHVALRQTSIRNNAPISCRNFSREASILWKFSLPSFLSSLLLSPVNWVCATMLVNQPDGYAEMGVFTAVNRWMVLIAFLPGIFQSVYLPILANSFATSDDGQFRRAMVAFVMVSLMAIVVPALGFLLLSPWLLAFYGEGFAFQGSLVFLIVLGTTLSSAGSVLNACLQAMAIVWYGTLCNLLWATAYLVSFSLLLPLKAQGLAISLVISQALAQAFIAYPMISKLRVSKEGRRC